MYEGQVRAWHNSYGQHRHGHRHLCGRGCNGARAFSGIAYEDRDVDTRPTVVCSSEGTIGLRRPGGRRHCEATTTAMAGRFELHVAIAANAYHSTQGCTRGYQGTEQQHVSEKGPQ
jgi:hypothetical protein